TPLNSSMAMEYSVHRISRSSSTRVILYSTFSSGRITGSSHVRSRAKTFAMKVPMGLVTSKTTAKYNRICNQPLSVISAFLRPQQCVDQVNHQKEADEQDGNVFQSHRRLTSACRTRLCTRLRPRKIAT